MFIEKDIKISDIPMGFGQVFRNKFILNIGFKEIIKMRNNGFINDLDMEIVKFLFNFRFSTIEQMLEYLNLTLQEIKEEELEKELKKLVQYRILNEFNLAISAIEEIQPDAKRFYCLDMGGKHLLSHYSNEDVAEWYTIINMKSSELVKKNLILVDFYLSLLRTCPQKIVYIKAEPEIKLYKKTYSPTFELCIKNELSTNYFLGDVVGDEDFPLIYREKIKKIEEFFESDSWKKLYFDGTNPPVYLLIADNDLTALNASKLITSTTQLDRFRVTSYDRLKTRLLSDLGAFMKYDSTSDSLIEVKSSVFLP